MAVCCLLLWTSGHVFVYFLSPLSCTRPSLALEGVLAGTSPTVFLQTHTLSSSYVSLSAHLYRPERQLYRLLLENKTVQCFATGKSRQTASCFSHVAFATFWPLLVYYGEKKKEQLTSVQTDELLEPLCCKAFSWNATPRQ